MKHTAVIGTGSIGLMLGSFLAKAGEDVTMVSQFRPEVAELLDREGIKVTSGADEWIQPVRAVFWKDLPAGELFDIVFITGKSNDTSDALDKMLPHLAPDGFVTSLQNGINDDLIADRAGADRVIPCVCFAGGQCPEPNHVSTHDGYFIIGEPSGERTGRLEELAAMLSAVKRVEITDDIRAGRWKKLSEVCLTVPVATASGFPLFSGYGDPLISRVFGRLAVEVMAVEKACGTEPEPIMGLTGTEWAVLAERDDPKLSAKFQASMKLPGPPEGMSPEMGGNGPGMPPDGFPGGPGMPPPEGGPKGPMQPSDAYSNDIAKGRPLEVWYTNGYVMEKAKEAGIDVPANIRLCEMIREIEAGTRKPCRENLAKLAG